MFNADQIKSAIRSIAIAIGAFFVGKGWVSTELAAEIAGGLAAFGAAIWGLWFHGGNTKEELTLVVADAAPPALAAKVEAKAEKAVGV